MREWTVYESLKCTQIFSLQIVTIIEAAICRGTGYIKDFYLILQRGFISQICNGKPNNIYMLSQRVGFC